MGVVNIPMKSKSTGLVGMYPKKHLALSDDLVPVDEDGNVCLPCMGVQVEAGKVEADKPSGSKPKSEDKK